jgi:DNA-binding HxlR family transcriptional regulator
MATPRPGKKTRGSRTGRPIMAALDLLGRRWTLRVLWELRSGALTFRGIQDACEGISPTVLNTRLRELKEVEIIESTSDGYRLTSEGRRLGKLLLPLDKWSNAWAKKLGG